MSIVEKKKCSKCKNDINTRVSEFMYVDGYRYYKCNSCKKFVEVFDKKNNNNRVR